MSHQCKSIGCGHQVEDKKQDFCTSCNYIRSIWDHAYEEEISEKENNIVVLDTYAVHQAFDIQDPSGCLQRASRLILLSGQMNDESDMPKAVDIMEARTMLTRWLQLNEYEEVN